MRYFTLFCCLLSLTPSLAVAAYQDPTVVDRQQQPSGFVKVVFQFTGNAGEQILRREYLVRSTTTVTALRNWVDDTKKELDLLHIASTIPALQPGQTVTGATRIITIPTGKEAWAEKLERYLRLKDAGIVAMAGDLAALKADLEATYRVGFLNP